MSRHYLYANEKIQSNEVKVLAEMLDVYEISNSALEQDCEDRKMWYKLKLHNIKIYKNTFESEQQKFHRNQ